MADWDTIKLPRDMVKHMEDMANSRYGKELGFTSKSQIAVTAVREFLKQYSDFMSHLELKDISESLVILRDHKLGADIKVKIKEGQLTCGKDGETCRHVDFVRILPRLQKSIL